MSIDPSARPEEEDDTYCWVCRAAGHIPVLACHQAAQTAGTLPY